MTSESSHFSSITGGRVTSDRRRTVILGLLIVAVGTILRWPGMFTAFWLDEIWSLELAKRLTSGFGVFTQLHHDNNHHLNTLWLYLLGLRDQWWVYRIPSLIAGVGTVALACLITRRRGRVEAVFASVLIAASYPLIHFSSEARGYAMVVFFAFATWLAVQTYAEDPRWRRAAALWICMALGFLSHLTFIHVFLSAIVWMIVYTLKNEPKPMRACMVLARGLGPPALLLIVLYWVDIRHIVIGGGPIVPLGETLLKTASLIVGGPTRGALAIVSGVAAVGLCVWTLTRKGADDRSDRWFFATVIFLAPVAFLVVVDPTLVYFRYFLVSMSFAVLLIAYALADLFRRAGWGRVLALVAAAVYLSGNAMHVRQFYTYGRGGYLEGLRHIVDHSVAPAITVASDHDFRNRALVDFYLPYLPQDKTIEYLPNGMYPPEGPMWVILHKLGPIGVIEATITPGETPAPAFRLEKVLPSSELSGWAWLLYRRVELASDPG